MAAANQKSDLVQIVLLTFALCAVFFTGWGIFSNFKANKTLAERKKQETSLKNLEQLLKDPQSVQSLKDHRRREESKENSGQIDTSVNFVLRGSRLTIADSNLSAPKGKGAGSSRVFEHQYDVTFNPAPIDDVYRFLARLEADQPHLEFRSITVRNRKRKPEDPDVWELDLTLVTYTSTL